MLALAIWCVKWLVAVALLRVAVHKRYAVLYEEPDGKLGVVLTLEERPSPLGWVFGRRTRVARWAGDNLSWTRRGSGDVTASHRRLDALNRHWVGNTLSEYNLKLLEKHEST